MKTRIALKVLKKLRQGRHYRRITIERADAAVVRRCRDVPTTGEEWFIDLMDRLYAADPLGVVKWQGRIMLTRLVERYDLRKNQRTSAGG